jgi:hypothetical protein
MRARAILLIIVVLAAILHAISAPALSKDYVVMLSRAINLRTGPGTERFIVGRAWKGDIFELVGETDSWYEIVMFSGEYRYVSKSWAAGLTETQLLPGHGMRLPASGETRHAIYRDIRHAKARAKGEAEEIIPESVNSERNQVLRWILEDHHIMEVMGIHSIQPALYRDLVAEMSQSGCAGR